MADEEQKTERKPKIDPEQWTRFYEVALTGTAGECGSKGILEALTSGDVDRRVDAAERIADCAYTRWQKRVDGSALDPTQLYRVIATELLTRGGWKREGMIWIHPLTGFEFELTEAVENEMEKEPSGRCG